MILTFWRRDFNSCAGNCTTGRTFKHNQFWTSSHMILVGSENWINFFPAPLIYLKCCVFFVVLQYHRDCGWSIIPLMWTVVSPCLPPPRVSTTELRCSAYLEPISFPASLQPSRLQRCIVAKILMCYFSLSQLVGLYSHLRKGSLMICISCS